MNNANTPKLTVITVLCSVLFFLSLTLLEAIPEIPVDIDFKPFFIPLAFIALLPAGKPAWAVGFGAALGEALRDILEGYELDDPIGFIGYVVGFGIAGYLIRNKPLSKWRLVIAAIVSGAVHAFIEATSFLIFGEETAKVAFWSAMGNTLTDGVILGAIPLVLIVPRLYGRVERYLGFAPLGRRRRRA